MQEVNEVFIFDKNSLAKTYNIEKESLIKNCKLAYKRDNIEIWKSDEKIVILSNRAIIFKKDSFEYKVLCNLIEHAKVSKVLGDIIKKHKNKICYKI